MIDDNFWQRRHDLVRPRIPVPHFEGIPATFRRFLRIGTTLAGTAIGVATAATLPYQGLATTPNGGPLPDSTYTAIFSLYADSSGANRLWSESRNVNTRKGLFSANLGSRSPIADSIFNGQNLFLGISLGGKPESTPRLALGSVPWAIGSGWSDSSRASHLADSSKRSAFADLAKQSRRADSSSYLIGLADSLMDIRHSIEVQSTAIASQKTTLDLVSMILVNGIIRSDSSRASRLSDSSKSSRYSDSSKSSLFAQRSKSADSAFMARVADSSTIAGIADSSRRSAFAETARHAGISDSSRRSSLADSSQTARVADSARITGKSDSSTYSRFSDSSRTAAFSAQALQSHQSDSASKSAFADSAGHVGTADSSRLSAFADSARVAGYADSARVARFADTARFAKTSDSADFAWRSDTSRHATISDTSGFSRMADSARNVVGYTDSLRNLRATIANQNVVIERQKTILEALGELVNQTILVTSNQLLDVRDGKTYPTVTIGTQTWMAKNLDFKTDSSWCFGNDEANCAVYGRLYSWSALLALSGACDSTACGSQAVEKPRGVCPANWHVPRDSEWSILLAQLGDGPGRILKTTARWANTSGVDSVGFHALPGGFRPGPGQFYNIVTNAGFWTGTQQDLGYAWCYHLNYYDDLMPKLAFSKKAGLSVRCVKD